MGNIQNKWYFADNGKCLGWHEGPTKPYQWLHYNETLLRARNFGSGLVAMGLAPAATTYVGIYSQNCPEWILVEQGAYCYSMVIVPLYDTLGPDACAFIINQGNAYVVVATCDSFKYDQQKVFYEWLWVWWYKRDKTTKPIIFFYFLSFKIYKLLIAKDIWHS